MPIWSIFYARRYLKSQISRLRKTFAFAVASADMSAGSVPVKITTQILKTLRYITLLESVLQDF